MAHAESPTHSSTGAEVSAGKRTKLGLRAHSSSGLGSEELISASPLPAAGDEKPSIHQKGRAAAFGTAHAGSTVRAASLPYDYLPQPVMSDADARPASRLVCWHVAAVSFCNPYAPSPSFNTSGPPQLARAQRAGRACEYMTCVRYHICPAAKEHKCNIPLHACQHQPC